MSSEYQSETIVSEYITSVLDGSIPACQSVKQACHRHLEDLEHGEERSLYFDKNAAQIVIDFFGLLKHSKGEWAGQFIKLEPWEQFIIWVLFGWMKPDGNRRFNTAYLELGRKNGKSTIGAGIGIYLLVADDEPGAEVYSAASKRDQAKITHSEATRMVKSSPSLRKKIRIYKDNLHIENTASKYEPLSSDYNSLDGLNLHGAIIDEVHAHKTRDLWDVLDTATGSRRQPLMFAITTAGYDRQSLCRQLHDYTTKILGGIIEDDRWFGIIYTLDGWEDQNEEGRDDWEDENNWIKANPNLGVSKKIDDMRRKAKQAKEMPAKQNVFLRKELNLWTQSESKWLNMEHWRACGKHVDEKGLRGRRCYGGLDLSTKLDITALVWVFPPEVEKDDYQILCRFWIPEETVPERVKKDRVPYDVWIRQGYIEATPGNVIDYDWILSQVDEDMQSYDCQEIAFDPWGAARIQTQLMEKGGNEFMVEHRQGWMSMSEPMKEVERIVYSHKLAHGNNPVLTWMADNIVIRTDPSENIRPDKDKSRERIDGIVALIMALGRTLVNEESGGSVYDERGIRAI